MNKIHFDKEKILEALQRSGYLFESEISKKLTKKGYFVESNKVIIDKYTGKSREIDLIAEYEKDISTIRKHRCSVKIKFVFEIKNNSAPLILLTEYQNSINDNIWESIKSYITIPEGMDNYEEITTDRLIYDNPNIYTQYCSFQEKKSSGSNSELMALHPDNIHAAIEKITQYCQENANEIQTSKEDYLRYWIYIPILLISEDLYVLNIDDGEIPIINKVEEATLIHNFHYNEEPQSCIIKIVTKDGLDIFLNEMEKMHEEVEVKMIKHRENQTQ